MIEELEDAADFAGLEVLSLEELGQDFSSLLEIATNQPDDMLVFSGLSQVIQEVYERGEVDMVMQMAMTIGALACLDSHFEDLASQAASLSEAVAETPNDEESLRHTPGKCKACQSNKACPYRR